MSFYIEVLLIGIGLSMDAFAASIVKGLAMRRFNFRQAFVIGGFFGVFQGLMPTLGWLLGTKVRVYIEAYDHWIAFGLLLVVGGKMVIEGIRDKEETGTDPPQPVSASKDGNRQEGQNEPDTGPDKKGTNRFLSSEIGELTVMAIATSIDALAVGISFAAVGDPVFPANIMIGCTTFLISLGGVAIGNRFGNRFQKQANIIGGLILVGIGIKILIEHLMG